MKGEILVSRREDRDSCQRWVPARTMKIPPQTPSGVGREARYAELGSKCRRCRRRRRRSGKGSQERSEEVRGKRTSYARTALLSTPVPPAPVLAHRRTVDVRRRRLPSTGEADWTRNESRYEECDATKSEKSQFSGRSISIETSCGWSAG